MKAFFASVNYLWAGSVLLQAVVCLLLIFRGHFRRLPFFTSYIALNICQAVFLYGVYQRYWSTSVSASQAAWWSEAITLVARGFATFEILRIVLSAYRGVWGLTWRLLTVVTLVTLLGVAMASGGDTRWALLNADRGYHLIFAVALLACLAMIRYYGIQVHAVYKTLLAGFCFYSCVKILIDTVLRGLLYQQYANFEAIWQSVAMISFVSMLALWGIALARALPEGTEERAVLPASVYTRIAPEIHYQLRAMNEQLMNFWKIEEPHS